MGFNIFSSINDAIKNIFGRPKGISPIVEPSDPIIGLPPETPPDPIVAPPILAPSSIPPRNEFAVSGSQWVQDNLDLLGAAREANILKEFQEGNIPDFLRNFAAIKISDGTNTIIYKVMVDYLCIGHDSDYVRVPMNPHTAQAIADQYDCTLITRKMTNDIWKCSTNKLAPKPWGPPYNADMEKTHRIGTHSKTIQNQIIANGLNPFVLTSGHKKDVVLTNKLAPNNPAKKVAIYGWIQPNGQPIQGLNPSSHDDKYADYSHGIRLVDNIAEVNGQPMRMRDVFKHPVYCRLVSDEGPLHFLNY